jgi:succinate dehydrogenase / fumarate reductase flavoprotein subunit
MGGLWVDYELMTNVPGLYAAGEANFSDHGANRLGASALMQGLSDGYFVIPYTLGGYLAGVKPADPKWKLDTGHAAFKDAEGEVKARINRLLNVKGKTPVDHFHRRLGLAMWEKAGMARTAEGLRELLQEIPKIREEFWSGVSVTGGNEELNQALERAGRVADFIELGELLALDALERNESCGGHFRSEYQFTEGPEQGECKPDHDNFCHVAAWEYKGEGQKPVRNVEPLNFEVFKPALRSYK